MVTVLPPAVPSALAAKQLCLWTLSMCKQQQMNSYHFWALTKGQALRQALGRHHLFHYHKNLGTGRWGGGERQSCPLLYRVREEGQLVHSDVASRRTGLKLQRHILAHSPPSKSLNLTTERGSPLLPNYFIGFLWGPNEITYMKNLENGKAFDKYHVSLIRRQKTKS